MSEVTAETDRPRRRWRIWGVVLILLATGLQLWLWHRGRLVLEHDLEAAAPEVRLCGTAKHGRESFTSDQVKLLAPAVERSLGGPLEPFSKRMSGGGIVPGSLLQVLIGEPLRLWRDYRAASAVILLFHLLALLLLHRVARESMNPPLAVLYLGLFALSPWRLYHGGFLWEPAYMLLPAALHLWAHWRSRDEASWAPSFALALALAVAPQLHASALVLLLVTAWFTVRRRVHLRWGAFVLGGLAGALPLLPTLHAFVSGGLDMVDESHPTSVQHGPWRWLYHLPRAAAYWLRLASLDLGRRYRQTRFLDTDEAWTALSIAAFSVTVIAILTALLAAYVNWRWLRGRLRYLGAESFLHRYAATTAGALLAASILSPVTLQSWHVLVALPAALIPLAAWLRQALEGARRPAAWIAALLLAHLACVLLLGLGHPMYAEPTDGPCIPLWPEDSIPAEWLEY